MGSHCCGVLDFPSPKGMFQRQGNDAEDGQITSDLHAELGNRTTRKISTSFPLFLSGRCWAWGLGMKMESGRHFRSCCYAGQGKESVRAPCGALSATVNTPTAGHEVTIIFPSLVSRHFFPPVIGDDKVCSKETSSVIPDTNQNALSPIPTEGESWLGRSKRSYCSGETIGFMFWGS